MVAAPACVPTNKLVLWPVLSSLFSFFFLYTRWRLKAVELQASEGISVTEFLSKQSECLHGIQGPTAQGSGETQVAQDSANRDALAFAHHLTEKRSEFST